MENELRRSSDRIADQAANFLPGGWKPELEKVLLSIEEVELRAGINSCARAAALYGTTGQAGRAACRAAEPTRSFAACFTLPSCWDAEPSLGNSPWFCRGIACCSGAWACGILVYQQGKGLTGVELKERKALSGLK